MSISCNKSIGINYVNFEGISFLKPTLHENLNGKLVFLIINRKINIQSQSFNKTFITPQKIVFTMLFFSLQWLNKSARTVCTIHNGFSMLVYSLGNKTITILITFKFLLPYILMYDMQSKEREWIQRQKSHKIQI